MKVLKNLQIINEYKNSHSNKYTYLNIFINSKQNQQKTIKSVLFYKNVPKIAKNFL